jgi:hypothetical protein
MLGLGWDARIQHEEVLVTTPPSDLSLPSNHSAEVLVGDRGRPINEAGRARKRALLSAWGEVQWLTAKHIGAKAGLKTRSVWQILHPDRPNLPTREMLRVVAGLFREQAVQLRKHAKLLDDAARETDDGAEASRHTHAKAAARRPAKAP